MRVLSSKETRRIGKHKKLNGISRTYTRRHNLTPIRYEIGQYEPASQDDCFMSGALPEFTAADNIRIRIGSETLTTAASTQLRHYARSQTSSESMLFDGEGGEDAARRPESGDHPRGTAPASHLPTPNLGLPGHPSAKFYGSHSPHRGSHAHENLSSRPDLHAEERASHRAAELDAVDQPDHQNEETDLSYFLTQRVGGVERSPKLVFDRSPSITNPLVSPTQEVGELQRIHACFDAKRSRIGHESRRVIGCSNFGVARHPQTSSVDGDELWRMYSNTSTPTSGYDCVADGTGTSMPQTHLPARNTRAGRTNFIADGNISHVSLSKVPASSPAVNGRNVQLPNARPLSRPLAVPEVNEDEALWQNYVLGSDPPSAIETIHTHNETGEDSMSRATKGYASTRLPLSDGITPVSSTPLLSTPFNSSSGQASRASEDVQYAPESGPWSITSATPYGVWCGVESPSEEDVQAADQGEDTSAPSHFAERSTHASIQNHASHSSAMLSDTQTSRSDLDQRSRAWDDVSRRAQASGSVVWQRDRVSSIWDISSSS